MKRNRTFWNIIAVILSVLVAFLIGFFYKSDSLTSISAAVTAGGLTLGFFAYKFDGVKIAGLISIIGIIASTTMGVVIIRGGGSIVGVNSTFATLGVIIGIALSLVIIGVILIIFGFISAIALILTSLIGAAIGQAVWKDKKQEKPQRIIEHPRK